MQYFFEVKNMNELKTEQQIILKEGKRLTIGGVHSVLSFDETYLKLDTVIGLIYAEGKNLIIENLSKDKKEIYVSGEITLIEIKSQSKRK